MKQLSSHMADLHQIWYEHFSESLSTKFKFNYNLIRITGTLHEDELTFFIYHAQFFVE